MRKVIALLLALTTALSVSVVAIASTDTQGILSDPGITRTNDTITFDFYGFTPMMLAPNTDPVTDSTIDSVVGDLVLVDVTNSSAGVLVYPETRLTPGEDYTFEIHQVVAKDSTNVTTEAITTDNIGSGNRLRITGKKGTSAISTAKIETKSKRYVLEMTAKTNYGTKTTDTEYFIQTTSALGLSGLPASDRRSGTVSFKVGYRTVSDADVDAYGSGDIFTIDLDTPVVTKKQLDRIAKENDYKPVILDGQDGDWTFEGRISGMSDTNFFYDYDVIAPIVERFEDQDFKFLNFRGGVNTPSNGTMTIDVSDISGEFDRMHLYTYRNGMLEKLNPTYDSGNDELVFRTNTLGTFVITDVAITNTTVLAPEESNEISYNTGVGGNNNNGVNPNTGTANAGIAIAFAATSLASAFVLGRKKK